MRLAAVPGYGVDSTEAGHCRGRSGGGDLCQPRGVSLPGGCLSGSRGIRRGI